MLKGNLSGFSLGEILQSLAINHHTGTLSILGPDGSRKLIYFNKGEIKLFSHGSPVAPRIGEVLVRRGKLTPDQLELALTTQKKSGVMLGKVLLDEDFVTEEDLLDALNAKIKEELYDLFLWKEGEFEFELDHCPEELFDSLQRSVTLTINPNGVIMEGVRRLDEWGMISSWIQTNHEIYLSTGENPPEESSAEAEAYAIINGETNVAEACKLFSGTRFECCKAIYNLLEEEAIRPLSLDELSHRAEASEEANDFAKATNYWRYAAELCPDEPQLYVRLGDTCKKYYQEDSANEAFLCAFRLYADHGDWELAADVASRLPSSLRLDLKDLRVLLQTFIELKDIKKALCAGNLLAESLQEAGEPEKAAEVLDSLLRLDPTDLNLRINIATLVQKAGDSERAIKYYEEVESALEQQKKVKDQIKILRLVADLDPSRTDVKQKIAMLVVLQEKLERRRKRRLTFAGISVILLVVCTVVPLVYELKAREMYVHAQRMEEISLSSGQFGRACAAYEGLITKYSWSTKIDEAKLALERINAIERNFVDRVRRNEQHRDHEQKETRRKKREAFTALIAGGTIAEKNGDLKTAHNLFTKALAMNKEFSQGTKIMLPVRLESSPNGAKVVSGESDLGTTPVVFHYLPGTEASFHVSLRGCEDHVQTIKLKSQHGVHFRLERKPSWEYVLRSNFRQSFHEASGLLIIPSRDGNIYAFDPKQQDVVWSRKVGRFGDRVSDLHVRGRKLYLSTVVGEVASIDVVSGTPHWVRTAVRGPVLAAPVTSEDGRFVAVASLHGDVAIVDEATGDTIGSFKTENEIVGSPVFSGSLLLVGSTDSHVYGYSTVERNLVFVRELSDEVVVDPLRVPNGVIVPTKDGFVHMFSTTTRQMTWSAQVTKGTIHSLIASDEGFYVASTSGTLIPVNLSTRSVGKPFKLSKSRPGENRLGGITVTSNRLYATHADGLLSVWDLKTRKKTWSWQADSPVSVAPVVTKDRIFVACNSGAIEVLEILE
jgi:outer membrane protein assembly factor BamB/Flp pilus assembly protein TadD